MQCQGFEPGLIGYKVLDLVLYLWPPLNKGIFVLGYEKFHEYTFVDSLKGWVVGAG